MELTRKVPTCIACGAQKGMVQGWHPAVVRGAMLQEGFDFHECGACGRRTVRPGAECCKPLRVETVKASEVQAGDVREPENGDAFRVESVSRDPFMGYVNLIHGGYVRERIARPDTQVTVWERDAR